MDTEKKICLIIEVHQPLRLRTYRFFEINDKHYYYDDYTNDFNINKIAHKYYIPGNNILMDLINFSKKDFNFSFLFSGLVLDQFKLYCPDILDNFRTLAETGCAGLISGTYSNLFGPLLNKSEYDNQVKLQQKLIKSVFGTNPISYTIRDLHKYHGYLTSPRIKFIIGNEHIKSNNSQKVNDLNHSEWLTKPGKLLKILNEYDKDENVTVNLVIPYNHFLDSEYNSRILEFIERFPISILSKSDFKFGVPSSTAADFNAGLQPWNMLEFNSNKQDLFISTCNKMQIDAFSKLYSFSNKIEKCNDHQINKDWLYLQACDHFYFMDPSHYKDGGPDRIYFPYDSHFLAYINYMNILADFSDRLDKWISDHFCEC
jgi:alpha-amylase